MFFDFVDEDGSEGAVVFAVASGAYEVAVDLVVAVLGVLYE